MATPVTSLTFQDVICFQKPGSKNIKDHVLPFVILPILLLVSTLSQYVTLIVMIIIAMGALYVLSRPLKKNRSPFFYSWSLSSIVYMYLVYQFETLRQLKITQRENFVFLALFVCMAYSFYKMKAVADFELSIGSSKGKEYSPVLTSDSQFCQICQIEVNERYFHSIWWACCVFRPNYKYFVAGQVFALATLVVGIYLGLTSACRSIMLNDYLLVPYNCDGVYYSSEFTLSFVTSIYAIGYLFVVMSVLIQQIVLSVTYYLQLRLNLEDQAAIISMQSQRDFCMKGLNASCNANYPTFKSSQETITKSK